MEGYDCDAVVIGAGAVGLAIARELALHGLEPVVLERHLRIGMETSSRNSEVIHAGIYYPAGSLKARLCRKGRDLLYAYCAANRIAAPKLGKLIVATVPEQEPTLDAIKVGAEANDVHSLRLLSPGEVAKIEPVVRCAVALHSPSTGILDSHAYMLSLLGDIEEAGGKLAYGSTVTGGFVTPVGRHEIRVRSDSGEVVLRSPVIVNSAGLFAARLARNIEGLAPEHVPTMRFAKGSYARLAGRSPFKRLVYPVPEPGGLGVHVTLDLGGQARFGPDVEWLETTDPSNLNFDPSLDIVARFADRIRSYWPDASAERLVPDYSGVRPKLSGPGEPAADFRIDGPERHGIPGLVNLFGIESPGLTSSLAIAREVMRRIVEKA